MKKWARLIIVYITILTGYFVFELQNLEFDYDYEKYFPKEDNSMKVFEKYRDEYGDDSDFLLIAVGNGEKLFDLNFLKKVKAFGDEFKSQKIVEFVVSPVHNCKYLKKSGFAGIKLIDYLDLSKPEITKSDSAFIFANEQFVGSFLPENAQTLCLFIKIESQLNKKESKDIIDFVYAKKAEYGFKDFHFSGRVLAQVYFVDVMVSELGVFMTTSIILLIGFLYISFRSWWGVVIPLIIIIISIIWTLSIMLFTGKSFDLLMVMLPTIIFVVGMSDLVHLLTKYLDELRKGAPKNVALKIAFIEVRWATFFTSLTTAIGFFALIFANISPIREFGIYAGVSVFVAYFLAFTLLPSVLLLVKPPLGLINMKRQNIWDGILRVLFIKVLNNQRAILLLVIGLGSIGVFTAYDLKINNFLLEDLSKEDPIKKDVLFFEENYSGLRPFEAEITTDSSGVFNYKFVQELEKLETYLKSSYTQEGVGFLLSPLTIIREANFVKRNSKAEFRSIPETKRRYETLLKYIKKANSNFVDNEMVKQWTCIAKDSTSCRVSGKIKDVGGLAIKDANEKLKVFLENEINPEILKLKLTGTAMLIDRNNETLAINLMFGLILAFGVIAIIVGWMFNSLKIALLSLIPNILPLLLVTTVMWFAGIDLKISTSLIFTLAFGIAVDDTIHLLAKYKLERKKGRFHLYALKRSYLSSGKAIIVTTLILVGGFLTLMFSSFTSTFYMGLLVSVTLIIAVVLDLLILPLIMLYGLKPVHEENQSSKAN